MSNNPEVSSLYSKVSPLNRHWTYPEYPWRAVDESSRFFYYKECPEKGSVCWQPGTSKYSETVNADPQWAAQHWENSLQSLEDWKRRSFDGKKALERPWEVDPQTHLYRAVDRNGSSYYYEHEPWIMPVEGLFAESKSGDMILGNAVDENWAADNWQYSMQSYQEYLNLIQPSLGAKNDEMRNLRKEFYHHPMWGTVCRIDGIAYNSDNQEIHNDGPLETAYQYDRRKWVEQACLQIIGNNGHSVGLNDVKRLLNLYDNIQDVIREKI